MPWLQRQQQPDGEPTASRSPRLWRWTRRAAVALAIAAAVAVVAGPALMNHLVEQERARIRAAGEPLTCADLVQRLPPGAPNAADLYQQAFDALERTEEEEELTGLWSARDLPPGWIESMRPVVEKNGGYFALLEEAVGIDACVFPVEWEKRSDAVQPHLAHVRSAARMLTARALVLAAEGRADEAVESCGRIAGMVQQLSDEPLIIGQLVRYVLISIGIRGIEQTLNQCDPSAEACRELYDALAEVELSESLIQAAKGERAWSRECLFDVAREATGRATGWPSHLIHVQLSNDERVFLRVMREQMEALALPWPEAKQGAQAAVNRLLGAPDWVYLLADAFVPDLGRIAESCRLAEGRRDVCRIGLALRAWQAEHGRYPDSLETLAADGWEVPRDSFTDEPYRYRGDGDGFIVWGVGMDLDDDDGKPFKPPPSRTRGRTLSEGEQALRNDYDIVFRCER